jgi:hypothetical protein
MITEIDDHKPLIGKRRSVLPSLLFFFILGTTIGHEQSGGESGGPIPMSHGKRH